MNKENLIARILAYIGFGIIVFGIFAFLILGNTFSIKEITTHGTYYTYTTVEETYNWALAIGGSVGSFISGVLMLGLSETIELLEIIAHK